jgi:hypothetical protein
MEKILAREEYELWRQMKMKIQLIKTYEMKQISSKRKVHNNKCPHQKKISNNSLVLHPKELQ